MTGRTISAVTPLMHVIFMVAGEAGIGSGGKLLRMAGIGMAHATFNLLVQPF